MRTHSHPFGPGAAARWLLALIAVLALVPDGGHRAASQAQYLTVAVATRSEARALNASGQVTGRLFSAGGGAFVWDHGVKTGFGQDMRALSINASGHVVGASLGRAFIWRNGVLSDLGTPGSLSMAQGINDLDQVVGSFYPPGFVTVQGIGRAFLWQNGMTTDLGTLGGLESRALAINNAGQVVGEAMTAAGVLHAFVWENGVMTDLGSLGSGWSVAWGINDLGQVVGASQTSTGCTLFDGTAQTEYHAVLWDRGTIHDLHANACNPTVAYGINNSGQIVGEIDACIDGYYYGEVCFAVAPFVYSHGVMTDLNKLAPGFKFVSAFGINDVGQIVANSFFDAYLLSPGQQCTSPDPFAAIGGGTCFNDGWLPPGMTVPSPAPAPSPAPVPTPVPVPAPVPPPTPGSCTTSDPFVSLGGGTCYNGGWLPPGVAPPPSPAPAPLPGPVTCTTPDPFVSLGGGTCYNGGWLPPGLPPPTTGRGSL